MTGLPPSFAPFTYKELLDGTFRIYRRRLKQVWLFSLLLVTPLTIWFNGGYTDYLKIAEPEIPTLQDTLFLILEDAVNLAVIFPLMLGVFAGIHEPGWTWKEGIALTLRRGWRILAGSVLLLGLQGLLLFLVTGIIGLPLYFISQAETGPSPDAWPAALETSWYISSFAGLFLLVRLAFLFPAVCSGEPGFRQAVRRSWKLSRGTVLKTAGILILLMFMAVPFIQGLYFLQELRYSFGITEPDWLWTALDFAYVTVVRALFEPLVPLFLTLHFRNRQAQLEGTDLRKQFKTS